MTGAVFVDSNGFVDRHGAFDPAEKTGDRKVPPPTKRGDRKVPPPEGEYGGGYILSRMAWPKPEQESSVTSSRPSRRMRRARS